VKKITKIILIIFFYLVSINKALSFEIIRDVELERFTEKIVSSLLQDSDIKYGDLNYYFINSNEINAFVASGDNLFINTEIIIAADDYREYAAVLAHELSHILGGHIFRTKQEINKLNKRAFPVYVLGILGILGGSSDAGLATLMVGSASVQDGYTYYSRNQEASADQAAVRMLCNNKIDGKYFLDFLDKIERNIPYSQEQSSYRSTHPRIFERKTWVESSLIQYNGCKYAREDRLQNEFELLKAKIFGFTHSNNETNAVYNSNSNKDNYAIAVTSYLSGDHNTSIDLLNTLIKEDPNNPFFRELLGEIYFSKHDYESAIKQQIISIDLINYDSDLYLMMLGNYYIAKDNQSDYIRSIDLLKKSLRINNKNTYSWYLLAKAYAETENLPLAQYSTAERHYLTGDYGMAYQFIKKSLKNIEKNTTEWYRANDLLNIIENNLNGG
tara:strand:+ start:109 stop:1437 length:1329 start_codon:yes stop_codon:yes gene_type:complete